MFLFCSILSSVENLGMRGDYPPGTAFRRDTTHMDVFMALFMICAIEIVVLRIAIFDESRGEIEERRRSASLFFDRD